MLHLGFGKCQQRSRRTDCLLGIHSADVTHGIVEIERRKGVDVKQLFASDCGIEHEHTATIPVAIDVFRTHVAHTGGFVVNHAV